MVKRRSPDQHCTKGTKVQNSRILNQNQKLEKIGLCWCINWVHNGAMKYGYARVSPGGKSESVDAQARQLTKAGCKKVFRDVHVSGAKTDRAQLRRVIEALEPGDVLMVTRLDRLARATPHPFNKPAAITAKKAGFR